MLKKTIKYTDYNGLEREEDFYFNLNQAELTEMEYSEEGGLSNLVQKIISTQDLPNLVKLFKKLILASYGVKSPDGRRFIKSEELSLEFTQTEAYVKLYMELAQNDKAAAAFINGIVPAEVLEKLQENQPKLK